MSYRSPAVVLLLTLVLALTPSVQAGCGVNEQHPILVPTFGPEPPPFNSGLTNGITVSFVTTILPGQKYWLTAVPAPDANTCVLSACVFIPDFNIKFYDSADQPVSAAHNAHGDQWGIVPATAAYGLVWMRYGPMAGGGIQESFEFLYRQNCVPEPVI